MSADNWAICPKCNARKIAAKEKLLLEAGAAYGKVKHDEYLRMVEAANQPISLVPTMREDYEIGTDVTGVFSVSYGCSCRNCNFAFEFKEEKTVSYTT